MNNTILLSIHTKYTQKILERTKRYEFRGWELPSNIKFVYIYSSRIEKKIVARFEIIKVYSDVPENIWSKFHKYSGVTEAEYYNYVNLRNYDRIYAIKIDNLVIFEEKISLSEIDGISFAPQKFKYISDYQIDLLERLSVS